jgi:hypothetical protein
MPYKITLFLFALVLSAPAFPASSAWLPAEIVGLTADARLKETSGLAPARRHPGKFWTHNDSGNGAELQLMSATGEHLATVSIDGVRNVDWEDLAGLELDGTPYLLIADTGDNIGLRKTLSFVVVEEPAALSEGMRIRPAWTVQFRWPDGARDCEAVAVDATAGDVLLISKKRVPPELFRVALRPSVAGVQVAERLGLLEGIAQPSAADLARSPIYGRYRSQVTAADLSPDGRTLAVLNYQVVNLYERAANAPWADALSMPIRLEFAWMPQAEAMTFSADGDALWVAGEQQPSPLIRFKRKP